jgi:hypothetical protein
MRLKHCVTIASFASSPGRYPRIRRCRLLDFVHVARGWRSSPQKRDAQRGGSRGRPGGQSRVWRQGFGWLGCEAASTPQPTERGVPRARFPGLRRIDPLAPYRPSCLLAPHPLQIRARRNQLQPLLVIMTDRELLHAWRSSATSGAAPHAV